MSALPAGRDQGFGRVVGAPRSGKWARSYLKQMRVYKRESVALLRHKQAQGRGDADLARDSS